MVISGFVMGLGAVFPGLRGDFLKKIGKKRLLV